MSPLQEWTGYAALCDTCGANITADHSEFSAWSDDGFALDHVVDCDGFVHHEQKGEGLIVLCASCRNKAIAALVGDDDEEWDALDDHQPEAIARLRAWIDATRTGTAAS